MMARKESPCRYCKSRFGGCKIICKSFKIWNKADKEEKARIDRIKHTENDFLAMKVEAVENSKDYARKLKGKK